MALNFRKSINYMALPAVIFILITVLPLVIAFFKKAIPFIIGFIAGWIFLSPFVNKLLPIVIENLCLINLGSLCLNFGLVEAASGLIVGFIISAIFSKK